MKGPPIVLEIGALPTAPYSPGEMMDMGISSLDDLFPSSFASYPSYTSNQISQRADGKWVETATGTVLNKWVSVDGKYRYYDAGVLQTNWKKLPVTNEPAAPERWFYFDANGDMFTGWMYISGSNTYLYLKPSTGIMAESEWVLIDGYWYYFDASGYMKRSWLQLSGKWYYLRESTCPDYTGGPSRPDGSMAVGEKYLKNKDNPKESRNYYFDKNGVLHIWSYPLPTTTVPGVSETNYAPFYVNSRFNEVRTINGNLDVHNGLDLRAKVPIDVKSPVSGQIVFSNDTTLMGNLIVIKTNVIAPNGNPLYVRVMHLSERAVSVNTTVSVGTYLGKTGATGDVAAHFHIDVNSSKTTTGAVRGMVNTNGVRLTSVTNPGQNPVAFFDDIAWAGNKPPHGSYYLGYTE